MPLDERKWVGALALRHLKRAPVPLGRAPPLGLLLTVAARNAVGAAKLSAEDDEVGGEQARDADSEDLLGAEAAGVLQERLDRDGLEGGRRCRVIEEGRRAQGLSPQLGRKLTARR